MDLTEIGKLLHPLRSKSLNFNIFGNTLAMNPEPRFDIFCGSIDKDAKWIECVDGLAKARQRMEQLALQRPGRYFLFSMESHAILAQIDTRKDLRPDATQKGKDVA